MTTTFNALFLGLQNYLSVTDANGHLERIQLTPEEVEHIVLAVDVHKVCAEQARAEVDAREIEASNERQSRFFAANPRGVA